MAMRQSSVLSACYRETKKTTNWYTKVDLNSVRERKYENTRAWLVCRCQFLVQKRHWTVERALELFKSYSAVTCLFKATIKRY